MSGLQNSAATVCKDFHKETGLGSENRPIQQKPREPGGENVSANDGNSATNVGTLFDKNLLLGPWPLLTCTFCCLAMPFCGCPAKYCLP